MAGSFIIDTSDIGKAEESLTAAYTKVRLREQSHGLPTRTRVWRTQIGSLVVDDFEYSYDLQYEADPMETILLCRVLKGAIEAHLPGHQPQMFTTGGAAAIGALDDTAYGGFVHRATLTGIAIDRRLLSEVAAPTKGDGAVQLRSSAPISTDAGRHVVEVIDHIRHTVINSPSAQAPFLTGTVARYLAATMLTAFPNNAVTEPTIQDRRDSSPVLLRRATAFIDDNADTDVSPADIAAATDVTPQALLNMFRVHRNCTPMEYLRRVRLHHAHRELVASDPDTTNVTGIARRWGFHKIGHFLRRHAEAYGGEPDIRKP
ncbi:helix-turn-helix transcriptional regulator [Mycolicibacterium stellerae]|uniref:helix-turn-helix transcriptional regulator n=1 Tax=Mycolicibacterium stellerae TaxID=2358193 RepID=UPI0013DDE04A|nr:helix-turn-helix transcriptional regulator [Mycolicibacterium stellerae]